MDRTVSRLPVSLKAPDLKELYKLRDLLEKDLPDGKRLTNAEVIRKAIYIATVTLADN